MTLRQKDEQLRSTLQEIQILKSTVTKLSSELLERKAEEEARLSEKEKELM